MARPQGQNPDGELARLLRAGRAHRSADHGRNRAATRAHAKPRRPFRARRICALTSKRNADALPPDTPRSPIALRQLAAEVEQHYADLEALEQRLTVLEEKMIAAARTSPERSRCWIAAQELDRQLRPYRGKMTADQLSMLEKQYLERNLLEKAHLPRLSLFYMR